MGYEAGYVAPLGVLLGARVPVSPGVWVSVRAMGLSVEADLLWTTGGARAV